MATKIGLINNALRELGHNILSDTGEANESGRLLTGVYPQVVNECLSVGSWNFATETIKAVADTGVTPNFGFTEVFAKPADFLRTVGISQDEYLSLPLMQYYDDANFWSADVSPIYIRYVSNDTGLGLELTRWPALFSRYVELALAERVCLKLTQSENLTEKLGDKLKKAKLAALNLDANNEPQPKFAPAGAWTNARSGGGRGDRGNRGSLTG